uniref:Deoxyribonuclease II n=1 Tax=Acrobeloides nanus TaxID=290746 RepID=A0A914DVC4_9BILA
MSCKGLDGRDVDWFVAIKYPEMRDSNRDISDGVGFVYADNKNPTFVLSNFPINSSLSAIGKTVNQALAKDQEDLFYALYNDDHPNGKPDSYRGHLKGALAFDDFQGFWLIHSVPKYPDSTQQLYTYPTTGIKYGQSFICVTFPVTSLNEIGEQLWFMQPSVYDYNLPESFKNLFPNLAKAVTKKGLPRSAKKYANVANLMSKGGTEFTSFAKHKKFAKDLYADLVATTLRKTFYAETWLNGKGDLGPSCNGTYNVYDVDRLQILGKTFVNSRDHSKWGISATSTSAIVCIGDINRQSSQAARGGGTMCVKNQQLWRNFKDAIKLAKCCAGQRSCLPP